MITNQAKKYWKYYIEKNGIDAFLDKVYDELDEWELKYNHRDEACKQVEQQCKKECDDLLVKAYLKCKEINRLTYESFPTRVMIIKDNDDTRMIPIKYYTYDKDELRYVTIDFEEKVIKKNRFKTILFKVEGLMKEFKKF